MQVLALEHAAALGVDDLALAVEHVVVLQDVLADLEVAGPRPGSARSGSSGRPSWTRSGPRPPSWPSVMNRSTIAGVEQPHQVVLQREVEPALAGVALAAGATAQLVVDAAGLVPLGAEDVEAAELGDLVVLGWPRPSRPPRGRSAHAASYSSGVSSGSRPCCLSAATARNSGLPPSMMSVPRPAMLVATVTAPLRPACGDDRRLTLVLLGVEHLVRDAAPAQLVGEVLALLDRGGADQHRLAGGVPLDDVLDDRVELGLLGPVDEVGLVGADHRPVRRDADDAELVDRVELGRLGLGRAGHAGELVVHAEVVLQGDRGERLVLVLDLDALLGLDRLVHALVVAAAGQHAAGVLVDDEDLAVR